MANDDQQSAAAGDQDQQGTAQDAQNQAQNGSGSVEGTPTPKDLRERGSASHSASGDEQGSVDDLPEWAQREIRNRRAESAQQRTARQQAEQAAQEKADERTRAILKAAGIETSDDEDPQQAAEKDRQAREAAEQEARSARVELAVYRAAPGKNADPSALLDSRSFLDRIKDLDPTDGDALAAAIGEAVEDNPRLATVQAAARSSADFTGGSGDGAITPEKFRAMGMQERNALYQSDPDTYRRLAAQR